MKETRNEIISRVLKEFMDDDNSEEKSIELYGEMEIPLLNSIMYEHDIELEIVKEKHLKNGNLRITLRKT